MRIARPLFSIVLAFLLQATVSTQTAQHPQREAAGVSPHQTGFASSAAMPVFFEANQGQTDPHVRFLARSGGYTLFLTPSETVLAEATTRAGGRRGFGVAPKELTTKPRSVLRMRLVGGNPEPNIAGLEELPGKVNYLVGNDPHAWHIGVPIYSRVRSEQVYPGVDLVFHGDDRRLEYDFVVSPGTDPSRVVFQVTGAKQIELDQQGDLVLHTASSQIRMRKPVIYQPVGSERRPVEGGFVLKANHEVGFKLAEYDRRQSLVIDPTITYATFLGGAGQDQGGGGVLDNITNASAPKLYVPGSTSDITTFPESHTLIGSSGAGAYIFLAKIDPTLTGAASLDYLTFIGGHTPFSGGGTCTNQHASIGLDTSKGTSDVEVVLSGRTDCSDYPVTTGSRTSGSNDLVLTRLMPGGALDLSVFFGGNGQENGGFIFVDPSGNVVLTSSTTSTDLPSTANAYGTKLNNGATGGVEDCFVTKLSRSFVLEYLTYLNVGIGTTATGQLSCGALEDSSGRVIAGGDTASSTAFNAAGGATGFQTMFQGIVDTFLMKLDPTLSGTSQLTYSTYFGGGGSTTPDAGTVVLNTGGVVAVAGNTTSGTSTKPGNIPLKNAYQTTNLSDPTSNKGTGFVAVVDTTKTGSASLIFSSYFGGNGGDGKVQSIAYDSITGNASSYRLVLGGQTSSTSFPILNALQSSLILSQNATVSVLDAPSSSAGPAAALLFSTYIGGGVTAPSQSETVMGVVTDVNHKIYACGRTLSDSFFGHTTPATTVNGFQTKCGSCSPTHTTPVDDTVVFVIPNPAQTQGSSTSLVSSLNPSTVGQAVTFTAKVTPAHIGTPTGTVTFKDGTTTIGTGALSSGIAKFTTSTLTAGTHSITAVYGGDATFLGSTSAVLSQVVNSSGPVVVLSPTSLTFSTQAIGTTSPAKTVTLKNNGTASLTISSIAITGTDPGDFAQTHTCGTSLPAGASCGISVTFKPTATGTRTAALSITDNAAGSPQKVSLSGVGTTAKLSPTSLNFGSVALGTTSAAKTVTLTNVGTTTLTITGIAITGTDAGDFAQTHTCGTSLAAAASCTISVTFKPTATGTRTAALSITDNAAGSPQKVSLSGVGTTAKLSPTSLNFGSVALGTTSAAKTVTLTNVGTTTLTITGIAITGTNAGDFAQTHTCGTSLPAGASCGISVTFKPTATGTRTAALSITDNAAGSPQKVSLTGTGT